VGFPIALPTASLATSLILYHYESFTNGSRPKNEHTSQVLRTAGMGMYLLGLAHPKKETLELQKIMNNSAFGEFCFWVAGILFAIWIWLTK
jgi:hypothetical protein